MEEVTDAGGRVDGDDGAVVMAGCRAAADPY